MANVAMLIGGVLANALAFTGSSYLFHRLSADNIDAKRKRHDAVIEKLQAAQIESCQAERASNLTFSKCLYLVDLNNLFW